MKSKIVILAIFVFLVSLLITLNVIFHESLRDELVAQYNKQQVFIAKGISGSIKTAIDKEASKLRLLARLFSQYSVSDRETLRKMMEETFAFDSAMKINASVYNKAGDVLFSTVSSPITEEKENVKYFYRTKTLSDGDISIYHDIKRVVILTPVYREKKFSGGILLEIPLEDLSTMFLTPFKSMEKGYAWLMDGEGNLLYHPTQHAMIGNNLYSAREECFRCHRTFELEKRVLQGPDVEFGRYIAPDKEDKVLAFSKIAVGESSWIISVSSPYTEVISITERSMKLYSWLTVAIFATVFLGASVVILIDRKRMKTEKEAREDVLLEKQKLDTIVSAIGSGLMLLDKGHKILWINKTLREWAGNVEGDDCQIVFPSGTKEDISKDICNDTFMGLFGKKGRTFNVTSAPVKDKDDNIIGVLKLIQDVTEVKKLEAGIMHSEKLAALGRLAAGIAHEIGNPLTSISSFAQILKERATDDFTKESLDTIYHHIMRISGIVSQMSQLSKLPEMDIKQYDINHLIESTLDIVKYDNKLKKIKIIKNLSSDIPPVYVDENYLVQVFINLMLNAADSIDGGTGTITINSMRDNNSVIVQFIDSGIGIPAESLNKIFDPFFTTKEKGTGLGLSISYEIIKKFGGELKAESYEGKGSIFSVVLPVKGIKNE
jgi:C4-dicarboxylate-specific signal transduction histidine kinase